MFTAEQLRRQLLELKTQRTSLEYDWSRVLTYTRPNRRLASYLNTQITTSAPFTNVHVNTIRSLYANVGATNSAILSSYLHSSLTNPHDRWMKIVTANVFNYANNLSDKNLKMLQAFDIITDQCHLEWQGSNFHQAMYPYYKSLVDIGNSCLNVFKVEEGGDEILQYRNMSMFNVYFKEDAYTNPNHVFCLYYWTADQIIQQYGLYNGRPMNDLDLMFTFGEEIVKSFKMGDNKRYCMVHCVYPSYVKNPERKYYDKIFLYDEFLTQRKMTGQKSMVDSYKDNMQGINFIREGYLSTQPYIISRIRREDESIFGVGHSQEALPLLLLLQGIKRTILIGAQKNVEPPLNVPSNRVGHSYSTEPNALNNMDQIGGKPVQATPTVPFVRLEGISKYSMDLIQEIDKIYMVDKIVLESVKANRTATEVEKRTGEEIKILSPFLGALEDEFLRPLTQKTLELLAKKGKKKENRQAEFVKAMNSVKNFPVGIKFVSDIARAQMAKSLRNMVDMFGIIAAISQKEPKVNLMFDWVKYARKLWFLGDGSWDVMKTNQKFQEGLQQMMEQNQQAGMLDRLKGANEAAQGYKAMNEGAQLQLLQGGKSETQEPERAVS